MARKGSREEKVKTIPNAKRKLIIMIISIVLMIFSVTQVYYLAKYTLGYEVSSKNMAVYSWVLKLVKYNNGIEQPTEYNNAD